MFFEWNDIDKSNRQNKDNTFICTRKWGTKTKKLTQWTIIKLIKLPISRCCDWCWSHGDCHSRFSIALGLSNYKLFLIHNDNFISVFDSSLTLFLHLVTVQNDRIWSIGVFQFHRFNSEQLDRPSLFIYCHDQVPKTGASLFLYTLHYSWHKYLQ